MTQFSTSSPDDQHIDANATNSGSDIQPQVIEIPQDGSTSTADTSPAASQPPSPESAQAAAAVKKEKSRVRFNSNASARPSPGVPSSSTAPQNETGSGSKAARPGHLPIPKPRPSVLRTNSGNSIPTTADFDPDPFSEESLSAKRAQERAKKMQENLLNEKDDDFEPPSRASIDSSVTTNSDGELLAGQRPQDIPMVTLGQDGGWQQNFGNQSSESQAVEEEKSFADDIQEQAQKLVASYSCRYKKEQPSISGEASTSATPQETSAHPPPEQLYEGSWDGVWTVPPPEKFRGGILSQLMKLNINKPAPEVMSRHSRNWSSSTLGVQQDEEAGPSRGSMSGHDSGPTTPQRKKWYEQNRSQETLKTLIGTSSVLAGVAANPNVTAPEATKGNGPRKPQLPGHKRRTSSNSRMSTFLQQEEARITVHIAGTLCRQEFIIKLCRALMMYGAPTHRLEEYLSMTARVLEIDGQFLYLPGCMVISFDDRQTHTTEVRMVRCIQGINLGKLKEVHYIYKDVMHDLIGAEAGTERLDELMTQPDKFGPWLRVLIFGLTGAVCAPFSFGARLIDLPITFFFGCLVGFLQIIAADKIKMYSNVFEVSAVVLVSFLARAFASIKGGDIFCLSALTQGGIVMLLPGYLVLCSSLELQSRAIVPGSIRIIYAIIYSLLLGFGITVGSALYGIIDENAVSDTKCHEPMDPYIAFAFVPAFVVCISMLYQAKWRQMPAMVFIAFAGYVVNFFSMRKFAASPQIASTLGAVAVGLLANMYSRIRHGVAAATMIPAIFTQVPGGLAATGGLLSGITTANMLNKGDHNSASDPTSGDSQLNMVVFSVAASMIQIAIGIAVGLFLSAFIVYPLGKRRSALFSF